MCSRPCICSTAASCRWRGCSPAISMTARRCNPPPAKPGGFPASSRSTARTTASGPRPKPAKRSRSASSTRSRPATRCRAARPRRRRWCSRADAAGAGDVAGGDRPQGRRQARPGAAAAERGRSVADDDPQPADPRHRAVGAGRDASARRAGAAQGSLRRQRQIAAAGDRLSGDHPQIDHPARPPQEAIRRPWPVRRRGAGDQADAARLRLRIPRKGRRRRGAAQLYRRGGRGRGRRAGARARSAFPSSTFRSR